MMTIWYSDALAVDAVLLEVTGNCVRVAVDGWEDAVEFRLISGQWFSEWDEPVDIGSGAHWCPEIQGHEPGFSARAGDAFRWRIPLQQVSLVS